jgi:putative PIN family toxin of toxin-antitoxin system
MAVSTAILEEYMEIISAKTNSIIAHNIGELLMLLGNVEKTEVYFRWNLITSDPHDNKFVDCAVSARVEAIVTNDKHFNILKSIDFPPVEVIDADSFLEKVLQL